MVGERRLSNAVYRQPRLLLQYFWRQPGLTTNSKSDTKSRGDMTQGQNNSCSARCDIYEIEPATVQAYRFALDVVPPPTLFTESRPSRDEHMPLVVIFHQTTDRQVAS